MYFNHRLKCPHRIAIPVLLAPIVFICQIEIVHADNYLLEEIDPTQFRVGALDDGSLSISPSEADELPGLLVEPGTYMGRPAVRRVDGSIIPHDQNPGYCALQAISPNGRFATGFDYGDAVLFDLETGAKINLEPLLPAPLDTDDNSGFGVSVGVRVTNSGHALIEADSGGIEGIVCSFNECNHIGINLPSGVTIKAFDLNESLAGIGNTNMDALSHFFDASFALSPAIKPPLYTNGYLHALNDTGETVGTIWSRSIHANPNTNPPTPAIPSMEYPALWMRSDYAPIVFNTGQGVSQIRFTTINNNRIAVGSAKFGGVTTAFYFDLENPSLGLQKVKDLVPNFPGSLTHARGINDRGTMLLAGYNAGGEYRHFLLRKVAPTVCRGSGGGSTPRGNGGNRINTLDNYSDALGAISSYCAEHNQSIVKLP